MRSLPPWTRTARKALAADRRFWSGIALIAALAPLVILVPGPLNVVLAVIDFEAAILSICSWVEQQRRPLR